MRTVGLICFFVLMTNAQNGGCSIAIADVNQLCIGWKGCSGLEGGIATVRVRARI